MLLFLRTTVCFHSIKITGYMFGWNTQLGKHFTVRKNDDINALFCLIDAFRHFSKSLKNNYLVRLKPVRLFFLAKGCFKAYSSNFGKVKKVSDWLTHWHEWVSLRCLFSLKIILVQKFLISNIQDCI